jgi:hypothetical protein
MNHLEKTSMSALIISKSFLYCSNPNTLSIVKPDPTAEILNRAKSGMSNTPIDISGVEFFSKVNYIYYV